MPCFYRWQDSALLLFCHVQPGASREGFAGLHGERLKIRLRAAAVDGKANRALCAFVASAFAVKKTQVSLLSGAQSRQKTLRIQTPGKLPGELAITAADKG
ncbi:DUF167 domain-containing protein [Spongiibacter sp.]|uniref:DUF167 domain-containing protein n=1 Tax=Spongiibacter sp. TaxID=2024860 RepID=UPI0035654FF7